LGLELGRVIQKEAGGPKRCGFEGFGQDAATQSRLTKIGLQELHFPRSNRGRQFRASAGVQNAGASPTNGGP